MHDAALIVISRTEVEQRLRELPHFELWRQLHASARKTGPVSILSARLPDGRHPLVALGFQDEGASPFQRLTLAGRLWKEVAAAAPSRVLIAAHGLDDAASVSSLEALASAVLAGSAPMPNLKSNPDRRSPPRSITMSSRGTELDVDLIRARHEGNHLARWLTMLPPNLLNCSSYRRLLGTLARHRGWRFQFFDETKLRRAGAGAFLAVSRANAHRDAGIVRLSYRSGARRKRGTVALIGKGVCFDTGGINLKPHRSMYHMHEDMQGSAVAVGTLLALTQLKAPFDVDCWLALTENEIGPRAYRPQEVVTAANGVTIQVVHSDAEGRMALADTLVLATRERPAVALDFATLTGACIQALTERMSGVFTNRPQWRDAIEGAGRDSGERVWGFPLDEDYDSDLDSPLADVMQCTSDNKGDHILAARFLTRFVPADIPWIHVDLSASSRSGGLAHIPTEYTGFGVRFATQLLLGAGSPVWAR